MSDSSVDYRPVAGVVAVAAVTAIALASFGQPWWCKCGNPWISSWDIWSTHNSQHLADPYSFSHVQHGFVFFGALWGLLAKRGVSLSWMLVIALAVEAAWEILENTPMVINRYRDTVSQDYSGDTVANSLADLLACGVGFGMAARMPWWGTVATFTAFELGMVITIRDSLILNVIMLIHPFEVIKQWQLAGAP